MTLFPNLVVIKASQEKEARDRSVRSECVIGTNLAQFEISSKARANPTQSDASTQTSTEQIFSEISSFTSPGQTTPLEKSKSKVDQLVSNYPEENDTFSRNGALPQPNTA